MQRCASKLCAVDGQRINTNAERAKGRSPKARRMVRAPSTSDRTPARGTHDTRTHHAARRVTSLGPASEQPNTLGSNREKH
jgi:hypothetical protein